MDTYFLLSAVFFVMLILFQGLQSVGKKMNKIANTYGVRKEKPQPYVKSEPKVEIAKEESKKPEDDNSFAQRCKLQIDSGKTFPYLDETILHTHSLKSAYDLISGEACCKSKGCTLDSQIHKNRRYVNSLASRQKHLRTGTIGKTKLEVLSRHDVIQ